MTLNEVIWLRVEGPKPWVGDPGTRTAIVWPLFMRVEPAFTGYLGARPNPALACVVAAEK